MDKVRQILLLHAKGVSNREIARQMQVSKNTVNGYVKTAKADGMKVRDLARLEEPVLAYRMTGGEPSYKDARYERLKARLPYMAQEIKRNHVTLNRLWEEYRTDEPDGYALTQFREHYRRYMSAHVKNTTALKDLYRWGEKLQIDFAGDGVQYVDKETGEIKRLELIVAVFPASDYGYALAIESQKTEEVVRAIVSALRFFGGVPQILVPDNMKAMVTKTDRYMPTINTLCADMSAHYGMSILPARPYKPRDKPSVENGVRVLYRRILAPIRDMVFTSREELNEEIERLLLAHNGKRMQNSDYSREELFVSKEKPALMPLPENDFEVIHHSQHKVGINGYIYYGHDKHYYSVPHEFTGQEVKVLTTLTLVRIFHGDRCIATHERNTRSGGYTTVEEHLASHAQAYRRYSPDYFISLADKALPELGEVFRRMFGDFRIPPETFYKGCQGLLHYQKTTAPALFKQACEIALKRGVCKYLFIQQLIDTECKGVQQPSDLCSESDFESPPPHENIRGDYK